MAVPAPFTWARFAKLISRGFERSEGMILTKTLTTWRQHPAAIGLLAALCTIGLQYLGSWRPLERVAYNMLFQMRQRVQAPSWDDRVAVIAIDEPTLAKYGQFPLSRDRYAQLLEILSIQPPAAIGFDILFQEPTPQDEQFAKAMRFVGNVVLPAGVDAARNPLHPLPVLAQAAYAQGHVLSRPDEDGISRRLDVYNRQFPSLAIALINTHNQVLYQSVGAEDTQAAAIIPVPAPSLTKDVQMWVNWPGPVEASHTYSFVDVMQGKVDPAIFANKFVLIGVTATGGDVLKTPFNQVPPTSGVYLHAAAIDNLINNQALRQLPDGLEITLILMIGVFVSLILRDRDYRVRLAIILGIPLVLIFAAFGLFWAGRWWVPVAAPIGTVFLTGFGLQLREQQEKQQLMSLFTRHMPPQTAELIWQRRSEIFTAGELQAQEMVATVMFSDIRGFTSISEQFQPGEMLRWLNRYLDAMTECIMENGGVVDKYIGDEIMAVFGPPFPDPSEQGIRKSAYQAICAALAMHRRLQELNQQFMTENLPPIRIGTGIHTGQVVAGSVGGRRRLSYSVLGDTVNVAARLQGMNKEITQNNPLNILASEETIQTLSEELVATLTPPPSLVGNLMLRGRQQPTIIYAIQG